MPGAHPRVALVTGANHGIGAATAKALAAQGSAVLCTFLRSEKLGGLDDPSLPASYRATRMGRADMVVQAITAGGGKALAIEVDLTDASVIPDLFHTAETHFGPISILVNNASGWIADTFAPHEVGRWGRALSTVTPDTIDQLLAVDARAPGLLIAEFARRHIARNATWGRIIGLTSGGVLGFPRRSPTAPPKRPRRTSR